MTAWLNAVGGAATGLVVGWLLEPKLAPLRRDWRRAIVVTSSVASLPFLAYGFGGLTVMFAATGGLLAGVLMRYGWLKSLRSRGMT